MLNPTISIIQGCKRDIANSIGTACFCQKLLVADFLKDVKVTLSAR